MCHGNVHPGIPLCDKAQFNCCCQVWSSFSTRVTHFVSVHVMLNDVLCSPVYASFEALLNFTVLCYGLIIINTASSGKGKWHIHTNRSKQNLQTAESWFCRKKVIISCPLTVLLQWFAPEPVQSKWCCFFVCFLFFFFLSETILDKSLFGKLKPFKHIYKYKELDLNKVKIVTWRNSRNIKLVPISCYPQLILPGQKTKITPKAPQHRSKIKG